MNAAMFSPGPPNMYLSLQAWNAAWEDHFAVSGCENDMTAVEEWLEIEGADATAAVLWTRDNYLPKLGLLRDQLVRVQRELTDLACMACAYDDFDARWTIAPDAECVLRGLAAACDAVGSAIWEFCPEARLRTLLAGGLLQLVHALCDPPLPDARYLPNFAFDEGVMELHGSLAQQAKWHQVRLIRNTFLAVVARDTLRAFYRLDDDRDDDPDRTPRPGHRPLAQHPFVLEHTSLDELEAMCFACRRPDPRGTLPVCARCQSFGRRIRYCDRRCQAADWPTHSRFCRANLFVSTALLLFGAERPSLVLAGKRLKLPKPKFKPSPALVHQLRTLATLGDRLPSYVIMTPWPARDDIVLSLPEGDRERFATFWTRAVQNGDLGSVRQIFDSLVHRIGDVGLDLDVDSLRRQLEREFCCRLQLTN